MHIGTTHLSKWLKLKRQTISSVKKTHIATGASLWKLIEQHTPKLWTYYEIDWFYSLQEGLTMCTSQVCPCLKEFMANWQRQTLIKETHKYIENCDYG